MKKISISCKTTTAASPVRLFLMRERYGAAFQGITGKSLGPVLIPCPPSDSTWRTRPLRYSEPHTLGLANRGWEVMVVSFRRWWCLNYASDSSPGCTGRELLHGYASCIVSPRCGFDNPSTIQQKCLCVIVGGALCGTILMFWARIKRCKGASRNKPLFEAWAVWF